jgi:ABC-type enterobactin transport system permease subunit
MDSQQWIEQLARQARLEPIPTIRIAAPQIARGGLEPALRPLPRWPLSLSAGVSLMAACLLLALGVRAQQSTTTTSASPVTVSSNASSTQAPDDMTALFSPLQVENH